MNPMKSLLAPRAIAVVGASQRGGRGASVIANLRDCGFSGQIFPVNPRYQEVHGFKCYPSIGDLPEGVECVLAAVGADATCDVLEEAHAKGIPAAVVLAAGFGEGGHGEARALRLRALAAKGMCICGPNCFGYINVKDRVAAFSGPKGQDSLAQALAWQNGEAVAAGFRSHRVPERRTGCDGIHAADGGPPAWL